MKRYLKLKYFLIGGISIFLVILSFQLQDSYRKYGPFRTMQDPITSTESVDLTGLRELRFIGGPLMVLPELKKRLALNKEPVIIVDGVHGKYGYVQGVPENYFDYRKESPSWKAYIWRLWYIGNIKSYPENIIPGAKAAKQYGFDYKQLHIGSKFTSSDKGVDEFVSFFDTLPENVSLYFHCIHGKGRTSMMLVMADIVKNAPKVTLKDIVKRHYLLGSVDLFDITPWVRTTYTIQTLEERKKFIEQFYDFISQRKEGGTQLWSEWNRQKKEG